MNKKIKIFILMAIAGISLVGALISFDYYRSVYIPVDSANVKTQRLVIESAESVDSILKKLHEAGFIRSVFWAESYLWLHPNISKGIQAGEYELRTDMSFVEIAQHLQFGTVITRVTLLEGWRIEQMAIELQERFGKEFAQKFLEIGNPSEGMLFPDTYFMGQQATPQQLVDLMRENYEEKMDASRRSQLDSIGLTESEMLQFAAIVEREGVTKKDREIIAGILIKRWRNDWALEADATVQYAMANRDCSELDTECDWWPTLITQTDLELESPFNTRKNAGLPPTPIANPGLVSIDAVLHYEDSDYWYYLSTPEGETFFSRTLLEHNENIARYL